MEPTEEQIKNTYRQMSTKELLTWCQSGSLTTAAQAIAGVELTARGVTVEEICKRVVPENIDYSWKATKVVCVGLALSTGSSFLLASIPGIPNEAIWVWLLATSGLVALRTFYWLFKF